MLARIEPMPLPALPTITTRVATMDDLPFVDALQKKHGKALGFFPRAQLEGYIRNGWMRVAEEREVESSQLRVERDASASLSTANSQLSTRIGYIAFRDRYLKRDELGAVFQLCVEPGRQRGLIGATLLQSAFDHAAYGCRLFCCWCAQDLAANRFWESMGFVPLAFRGGSTKKSRVHIYWQKRIRAGDRETPFWFPAKTDGGAIREDRLVLPIPRGLAWDAAMPVMIATEAKRERKPRKAKAAEAIVAPPPPPVVKAKVRFGAPGSAMPVVESPKVAAVVVAPPTTFIAKPARAKVDPTMVAAARELRDRWMDELNAGEVVGVGKYDVARLIEARPTVERIEAKPVALLAAA